MMRFVPVRYLILLLLAASTASCDNTLLQPTPDRSIAVFEVNTGTLDPGAAQSFTFSISEATHLSATFAGAVVGTPQRSIEPTLEMGVGFFIEDTCLTQTAKFPASPRLTSHVPLFLQQGVYCVSLRDTGALTEPTTVVVRLTQGLWDEEPDPRTVTFASNITVGGSASRSFTATTAGQVTLSLTSLSPGAGLTAGVGIGVEGSNSTGCKLTKIVHTGAGGGPHVTAQVDPGDYCVSVFDIGTFIDTTSFSLTIAHP
jgi:hypothetical protein